MRRRTAVDRLVLAAVALLVAAAAADALRHSHGAASAAPACPPPRAFHGGSFRLGPASIALDAGLVPGSRSEHSLDWTLPVPVVVRSRSRVVLRGNRCPAGAPLRFSTGSPFVLPVRARESLAVGPQAPYRGYALFPAPGRWRLTVAGRALVVDVTGYDRQVVARAGLAPAR